MSNWSVFKTTSDRIGMGFHQIAQQKSFETLQDKARERVLRMIFNIQKRFIYKVYCNSRIAHLILYSIKGEFEVSD